ncbi:MAG: Fic family protein, partial [Thermodesulfobacteriota bacterium]
SPVDAHYVPPPVFEMNRALDDFEKFLHSQSYSIPSLIKTALMHSQFELIHPFLDGNGRTGRLLITLHIWFEKLLDRPVLFLSSYFKKYQQTYYDRLDNYRNGDVDKWLDFFLDGVVETAEQAIDIVRKITILREEDMKKIQRLGKTASKSAVVVLPQLFKLPIVNLAKIKELTGFTRQGAYKVIDRFIDLGILEIKDETKKYGKIYIYRRYVDIFMD